MRIIQVAGTNGKGSVSAFAAQILQEAGYKCGLFISPHLCCEEERISINGQNISSEAMHRLMQESTAETLFGRYTDACVKWFRLNQVDVAVMETGLGGRRDPVTSLPADVTVLTRIGMDHMEILGDTIEKIALEKCRTIRYQGYVVSMEQLPSVEKIIQVTCDFMHANLTTVRGSDIFPKYGGFDFKEYEALCINLMGRSQPLNAATAIMAVRALAHIGIYVEPIHIRNGLRNTKLRARVQFIKDEDMLIDGGHNEDALRELQETLDEHFPDRKMVFLIAAMKNKDVSMLRKIADQRKANVVITQLDMDRCMPAKKLAKLFRWKNHVVVPDFEQAYAKAKLMAKEKGALLVVAGSFYLAGEVLKRLDSIAK